MDWDTDDPLGIGGLLLDAWRMAQLIDRGILSSTRMVEAVVSAALAGLQAFTAGNQLKLPARYRLAFRELGLAIGLKGVVPLREWSGQNLMLAPKSSLHRKIKALAGYLPLAEAIEQFWLEGGSRHAETWREHREINMVMLATSLAPGVFLSV